MKKTFYLIIILSLFYSFQLKAEVLKKLEIKGNSRISEETLKVYGEIQINKDYSTDDMFDMRSLKYSTLNDHEYQTRIKYYVLNNGKRIDMI